MEEALADSRTAREYQMNVFEKWPLGINENMDRHAAASGMAHWSCTDPKGNLYWIRKDGVVHVFRGNGGYADEIRAMDSSTPMRHEEKRREAESSKEKAIMKWNYKLSTAAWYAESSTTNAYWRIHVIEPNTDGGKWAVPHFGLFSIYNTSNELFRDIAWSPFQSLKAAQDFCQECEDERNAINKTRHQLVANNEACRICGSVGRGRYCGGDHCAAYENLKSLGWITEIEEIKPPDLSLAYSALAPLVAEANAFMRSGRVDLCSIALDHARAVIEQVTNPPIFIQYPPTAYLMTNAVLEEIKRNLPAEKIPYSVIANMCYEHGTPIESYETEAEVTARRIILEAA